MDSLCQFFSRRNFYHFKRKPGMLGVEPWIRLWFLFHLQAIWGAMRRGSLLNPTLARPPRGGQSCRTLSPHILPRLPETYMHPWLCRLLPVLHIKSHLTGSAWCQTLRTLGNPFTGLYPNLCIPGTAGATEALVSPEAVTGTKWGTSLVGPRESPPKRSLGQVNELQDKWGLPPS